MAIQDSEVRELLRGYELRLLRCTLSPPSPPLLKSLSIRRLCDHRTRDLHSSINELLNYIEAGNYFEALSSDAARLVTESAELVSLDRVSSQLVEQFVGDESGDVEERACKVVLVLCVAVAAFFCFTQINFTGPLVELPKTPPCLGVSDGRDFEEWENWARNQLMADGSDLLGKLSNLQYLVFAKTLVMGTKDMLFEGSLSSIYGIRSISWWLARVLLSQQRVMDELSSSLFDLLQVSIGETLHHVGSVEAVMKYWGSLQEDEALTIVSTVHLESGIVEHLYGRVDSCRLHFKSAEAVAGLQLSVTGVLGYRTAHQVEPKAQMVLVTNRSSSDKGGSDHSIDTGLPDQHSSASENNLKVQQHETTETSDILMKPLLLNKESNQTNSQAPLKPVQQAVILANCLLIENSSRSDELQKWDRGPFIEAIDAQSSSPFALRFFCDLMRIRWESTRSRTKERALEMMDALVESLNKPSPTVAQRIPFSYSTHVPCISALRKEYGELLVSFGLTGEAIQIFEDLELWDSLIFCYQLLGKKAAAVELINKRLSEAPNDPRLWCVLGDVTNNDSCYQKALQVSNDKSARAKRSLARSAYNRGDFETSKILWESAMALNSLCRDGWFALGAAALKARDVDKALDAFTRAVQLDPENGEAWNNIACLHMIKKKSKEAFIAFKEALKIKRDSWQMWDNFSHVAVDTCNFFQALEAIQTVLQMSNGKRVDYGLLERIMLELERRGHAVDSDVDTMDDWRGGRSRETEQLMDLLGKILQQAVRSESKAETWGLYANWLRLKGDLTMCSEALLKQVRSYQGSDLWKDKERFKKFAHASLLLCKVYMEISSSTGSRRELFSAEMHLKNIIKQAESFSDTEEYRDVQACLDEVRKKLET